jgi:DNA invertase Pin-like site-specific DNA recombinase
MAKLCEEMLKRKGIALAKKAGVYKGRKPSLTTNRAQQQRKRKKKAALAREFGISRETLYRYSRSPAEHLSHLALVRIRFW